MIRLKLNLLLLFISSLFTNSESFDGMFLLDCHHFPHYTVHFFILWDLSNSAFQPIDPLIPSTFPHLWLEELLVKQVARMCNYFKSVSANKTLIFCTQFYKMSWLLWSQYLLLRSNIHMQTCMSAFIPKKLVWSRGEQAHIIYSWTVGGPLLI